MNASDTRSKKTMEEHISQLLNNKTMDGFLTGCQISVRFGMTDITKDASFILLSY